jgi:Holliday junction resolvase RusA-like endonuclease
VVITHSNRAGLLQWRADIRAALQAQLPRDHRELLRGPVAVRVRFLVTKPPSVPHKRVFPVVAPDLDKLVRAVGDALEKILVLNDAQIVGWEAWKIYTDGPAQASIALWTPEEVPALARETNPFQEALF